jgi:hypothetical protein
MMVGRKLVIGGWETKSPDICHEATLIEPSRIYLGETPAVVVSIDPPLRPGTSLGLGVIPDSSRSYLMLISHFVGTTVVEWVARGDETPHAVYAGVLSADAAHKTDLSSNDILGSDWAILVRTFEQAKALGLY